MASKKTFRLHGLSIDDLVPILDSIDDGIFIDDAQGYTILINKASEDLYKIKRSEIIGKHISYLEQAGIFTPSVAQMVMDQQKEVSTLHKNKAGKRLLTTGTPIFDNDGNLSKIITTSRDITELVDMQNKFEEMQNAFQGLNMDDRFLFGDIVANSPTMHNIINLTERLADVDSTILITGESGSGKGVIARLLHDNGQRRDKPFIQINCGAIPDNLLESELFGYESGAFTGSRKEGKRGLFEAANGGTIFLDEISELPINLQVKILQVIQEKQIQRVGSLQTVPVDVRIISASNKDLDKMVREGRFREDLYYRLNVIPINIPPLRERPEDIIPMIRSFLLKNNQKFKEVKTIDSAAMSILISYPWPGNVRELENIIERLVITTRDSVIKAENLPSYIYESSRHPKEISLTEVTDLKEAINQAEKRIFEVALSRYKSTRQIAKALNISQPTVVRKLNKYNLTATDA